MLLFVLGLRFFTQCRSVNFKHCMAFTSPTNFEQGGSESHSIHCPTKTVVWDCDIGTDHPDVPAIFQFFVNGNRLSQEPACRFSTCFNMFQHFSTFFNIFQHVSTFSTHPSTWCQYGFCNLSRKSTCFQPGPWRSSVLTLTRVYSLTQSCQV